MANIKISELNPLLTVTDADVIPIVDNAVTKKVTAAILRSYTEGNSVLLTGAQTIAGIKTFTAQLASSVATGTAPFSVASTTKVTNLNADLLDGLSSAAFQGALTLTTTGSSGASTLNTNTLNVPNYTLAGLGGVPYTGATGDVNLGTHDIYATKSWLYDEVNDNYGSTHYTDGNYHIEDADGHKLLVIEDGFMQIHKTDTIQSNLFTSGLSETRDHYLPNASGTLALTSDLTSYVPTTRTVSTTSPLAGGGNLGANLTLSIPQASGSVNGYLASTDFATFNAKQNAITLTTTGTSGAATLVGSTLNIPNYADTDTGITSLNGLTALTQTFAVGMSGTDFGISSATSTHTFNLPTASASNRGALSSADWTTFNNKQNALTNPVTGTGTTNYLPKFTGASALGNSIVSDNGTRVTIDGDFRVALADANINLQGTSKSYLLQIVDSDNRFRIYDNTVNAERFTITSAGNVGIGTTSPTSKLHVLDSVNTYSSIFQGVGGTSFVALGTKTGNVPAINGFTANFGGTANIALQADGGNVLIGTTNNAGYKLDVNGTARVIGQLTVLGSSELGSNATDVTAYGYKTRISGASLEAGGTYFGSYGNLILSSNQQYTASAKRFMITNALDGNKFAIVRSVDALTDPSFGLSGALASGTADLVINNTGAATFSSSLTAGQGKFYSGSSSIDGLIVGGAGGIGTTSQGVLRFGDAGNIYKIEGGQDYGAMNFITNGSTKLSLDSSKAKFTLPIEIENTISVGVAVASTHKVTIVIGGATYYLLATNV